MIRCAAWLVATWLAGSAATACAGTVEVREVSVIGNRTVTLVVTGVDPRACCSDPQSFRLIRVRRGRVTPIQVVKIGADARVVTLTAPPLAATVETRVHLRLDRPLDPRVRYRLVARDPALAAHVVFDPEARSPAIRVNQLGYVPRARKVAIVGAWLGTAGAMPVDDQRFDILDASGSVVFQGPLELRAAADPWSGEDVYVADFSAVVQEGRYVLRVPGLGVSDEFVVGDEVYDRAYREVLRVLYHQRNSTPIEEQFAAPGYARPGGIPARLDAVLDVHAAPPPFGDRARAGQYRESRAGWFDAGDYGQYVPNAAPVWFYAGLGLDLAPANFRDSDLGIPESGNGIPDILDELEWGFDWMLSMQDARDGGVYFRVASEQWDDGLPQLVRRPRLIAEKTTHATASFAAAAAIHARLLKDFRPDHAARAIAAAEAAWSFLREVPQWPAEGARYRNRPGMHAGEYSDTSARDNELWAAAEMLRTTGKKAYLEFFESNFQAVKLDPTGDVSYSSQEMAALWAYLQSSDPRRDPAIVDAARRAIIAGADWRIRQMRSNPWLAPTHPRRSLMGWGSFAHSARAALTLLQAHRLTGERRYVEYAWLTPGPQLGVNPQGLSYVTGLGARAPRHPLSKLSQYSGAPDPLPGLPVHGPHARLPGTWPTTRAVTSGYWPVAVDDGAAEDGGDGYPVLRRYTDSDQLPPMSEPTVAEIARDGIAYGLLRNGAALAATPAQQ